MIDTLHQLKN